MSVGRMKKKGSSPIARMLAACIVGGGIVAAQDGAAQEAPSSNATVNLIRLLVKQHVITQEAADALLKQAEQEAVQAQRQTATVKAIAAQPPPAPATQLSTAATTPPPAGTLRIPYVPEIVKKQIKEDVKKEVIEEAKNENWAQPNAIPEWTKRIKITGDLRSRDEYDLFSSTNDNQIIDFQSFNANGPTDINALTNNGGIPILNTTQDRLNRLSLRARLGVEAVITDDVFAGLRLASGGDNGPVSTTQLLGGGWGKKDFWLDQAYLTLAPSHWFAFTTGRMANPFFHSDLVYDPDLNFDGAAATVETKDHNAKGLDFFATEGLFPLEYIGSNFPNDSTDKSSDHQKWLWGSQAGFSWKTSRFDWKFAGAYYQFGGTQGELSDPCFLYLGDKQCSTDWSHPAFMQKGNTLFLTRQIVLNPKDPTGGAEPQYAGLAFNYHLLNAITEFSMPIGSKYRFIFDLDYVHNLSYRADAACRYAPLGLPITNVEPGPGGNLDVCDGPEGTRAKLASGADGYYVNMTFGYPQPRKRWEWNVSAGYKYLEPDATLDAYTDSDFHLGGTNARGYIVSGSLGLFDNVWLMGRWLSASEVYGPPMAIDVVQLDLNAGF